MKTNSEKSGAESSHSNERSAADWICRAVDGLRKEELLGFALPMLERYEIHEELGRGGMATVYRATDRLLRRSVALKLAREDMSRTAIERFGREAEASARLCHRNVVRIYDAGAADGRPYLVMELIEGQPLDTRIPRTTRALESALRTLEGVARGVHVAHRHGIVHRDLKPANILVDRQGIPRVTDFGLAHIAGSELLLTRTGAALGTPLYMAPEQVRGSSAEISPRTDVYALGVILYEILTGTPPHAGTNLNEVYQQILDSDPVAPKRLNPAAPRAVVSVCLCAIAKDPARRYAHAGEFAADLRRCLHRQPIHGRPPGIVQRSTSWIRGRATSLGLAAGIACAIALAFALASNATSTVELARAEQVSRLHETLAPTRLSIQQIRSLFYASGIDIGSKLDELDHILADLEEKAKQPGYKTLGELWFLKALAEFTTGRSNRAEESLDRALELEPKPSHFHQLRSQLYLQKSFLAALGTDASMPDEPQPVAEKIHDLACQSLQLGNASQLKTDLAEAILAFIRGQRSVMAGLCERSIVRHKDLPGAEDFWTLLGLATFGKQRIRYLSESLRIQPHGALCRYLRAITRLRTDNPDGALEDLDAAIQSSRGFAVAYRQRAALSFRRGKPKQALTDLESAQRFSEIVEIDVLRGQVYESLDRHHEAKEAFTQAITKKPGVGVYYFLRAGTHSSLHHAARAIADYQAAARLNPDLVAPVSRSY